MYKYPFIKPEFPSAQELIEDYEAIISSNWFTNFGPYEKKLSLEAASYINNSIIATTVANCTLGLEIAISELFNSSKKRVIIQSFTFAAGPEMIIKNGFTPLFIDVNILDWQADINQARSVLQTSTDIAGILLCNTFGVGNIAVGEWETLAKEYNVPLIIDTAAGFGSRYTADEIVGGRGDCEIFSLHATKPFAVGEGGLITSKSPELIEKLRSLQNFGFGADRTIHHIGTNAKMQEINCAIGSRQLAKLSDRIAKRQSILGMYKEVLLPFGFEFQANDELSTVAFVSVLTPKNTNASLLQQQLIEHSIEARRYYTPALHEHVKLSEYSQIFGSLDSTNEISARILSLPLLNSMTTEDVQYICNVLIDFNKDDK